MLHLDIHIVLGMIRRYAHNVFSENWKPTIGVDFAQKLIDWNATTEVSVQLWDVSGQERFGAVTRCYYRNSSAAMVVFDITQPDALRSVVAWKQDINDQVILEDNQSIPCFLVANKVDLKEFALHWEQMKQGLDEFCQSYGLV